MKTYKTLPDGIEIVEYEDSLAQAVADMWNKSGEGWGGSIASGIYTAEQVISKRASGAFFNVYIAMKDGEALGYCSFDRYYKDEDTAYVHLLNVRPDYHGKKIGKELVLMCVYETITRGMPRLDIHTWPGNVKSVPLYKKCGFFLEDRTDTTHLCNFIPTVLSTEVIKDYFEKADWYNDSARVFDMKPDGAKVNKFELFEYKWLKDGAFLRVGFEKSGRRINLIETADYIVEMTAENHELAYGLNYPCKFIIKNKTGKELNVDITAKDDSVISFDGSWSGDVESETTFTGTFFVNAITEAQDTMRMHPCVLADIIINGKKAEFGLGIEPKFPVTAYPGRKQQAVKPGMTEEIHINLKNGLSSDAKVSFSLPENKLLKFAQSEYEVDLAGSKDMSLTTTAQIIDYGYAGIPVEFEIKPENGEPFKVTRPLHIVNQGITGLFGFETDEYFGAANGLWRLRLKKDNNDVYFDRLVPSGKGEFNVSQLGKPYDEEFNIMKTSDVRVTQNGAFIRFEADYISGKFEGAVLTEIYEFDAAGTLNRSHRVTNNGTAALDLSVKIQFWTNIGKRAIYHYDGAIHEVADKMNYGFDSLDTKKIDENWIFDNSDGNPSGIFWPPQYKPDVKWGDFMTFEFPTGALAPAESFETEPVVYMCDVFKNFTDFRNYVLGLQDDRLPLPRNHLEIITNDGNPVLSTDSLKLTVRNNRLNIHKGTVAVSSPDRLFVEELQENPDEELRAENTFTVSVAPGNTGIGIVEFSTKLSGFEMDTCRALFITDNSEISIEEKEGVLTVKNGKLTFKASPEFSDAVFSLQYDDNEWFYSLYPTHDPYSWWNPFIGGLKTYPEKMGNSLVLREDITASIVSEKDKMGNLWKGIKTVVTVENFDLYKGLRYSNYYLTLPGVPVMCHFTRLENRTGRYMDAELFSLMFLSDEKLLPELGTEFFAENNTNYKLRDLSGEQSLIYERLISFSREGEAPRSEKLYIYKDAKRDRGRSYYEFDITTAFCEFSTKGHIPDNSIYTTKPIFCILTEKELTPESLKDLDSIEFA